MSRRKILSERPQRVYKICSREEWRSALARGVYEGSADDLRDGYIHLSTAGQLRGVLARHFAGRTGLVIVALERAGLGRALKWEENGAGVYPHLYAPLNVALALEVHDAPVDGAQLEQILGRPA